MKRVMVGVVVAVLVSTAAWGARIEYDFDAVADFSTYQSFAWKETDRNRPNPLAAKRIAAALENGFKARGYSMSTANGADFVIDFQAALSQAVRVDETWWGVRRRRGWVREIDVTTYPVGTLAVVVIDGNRHEVVWRGTVSGAVSDNPEKLQKMIDKAVTKLLKKFPPPR